MTAFTRTMRQPLLPVMGLLAVMLALTGLLTDRSEAAALRHTRLVNSAPAKDSTVNVPPQRLQLWFNEVVPLGATRVRVTPAGGAAIALTAPTRAKAEADSPVEFVFSRPLADGRYTVDWATASADGHAVNGSFTFTVRRLVDQSRGSRRYSAGAGTFDHPAASR
jgi:methionine-rich copper-binding protein CopC